MNDFSIKPECYLPVSDCSGTVENCPECFVGGGKRDRTADLLHAMQALSQLSYTPHVISKL